MNLNRKTRKKIFIYRIINSFSLRTSTRSRRYIKFSVSPRAGFYNKRVALKIFFGIRKYSILTGFTRYWGPSTFNNAFFISLSYYILFYRSRFSGFCSGIFVRFNPKLPFFDPKYSCDTCFIRIP